MIFGLCVLLKAENYLYFRRCIQRVRERFLTRRTVATLWDRIQMLSRYLQALSAAKGSNDHYFVHHS
jgi:hypothetical protein